MKPQSWAFTTVIRIGAMWVRGSPKWERLKVRLIALKTSSLNPAMLPMVLLVGPLKSEKPSLTGLIAPIEKA